MMLKQTLAAALLICSFSTPAFSAYAEGEAKEIKPITKNHKIKAAAKTNVVERKKVEEQLVKQLVVPLDPESLNGLTPSEAAEKELKRSSEAVSQ